MPSRRSYDSWYHAGSRGWKDEKQHYGNGGNKGKWKNWTWTAELGWAKKFGNGGVEVQEFPKEDATPDKIVDDDPQTFMVNLVIIDLRASCQRFEHQLKSASGKTHDDLSRALKGKQDDLKDAIAQKESGIPPEKRTKLFNSQLNILEANLTRVEADEDNAVKIYEADGRAFDLAHEKVASTKGAIEAKKKSIADADAQCVPTVAPILPPVARDEAAIREEILAGLIEQKTNGFGIGEVISNFERLAAADDEVSKAVVKVVPKAINPPLLEVQDVPKKEVGGANQEIPKIDDEGNEEEAPEVDPEILAVVDPAVPDAERTAARKAQIANKAAKR